MTLKNLIDSIWKYSLLKTKYFKFDYDYFIRCQIVF